MKFLGQWQKFLIKIAKTEKLCPEEQIKENHFSKEKSLLFFQDSESLFSIPAETFAKVVETVTYVALEDFEGKNIWNLHNISTLDKVSNRFGLCAKIRTFSRKVLFMFVETAVCACRKKFSGFFFSCTFCFFNRFLEFEQLLSHSWQTIYPGVSKNQST